METLDNLAIKYNTDKSSLDHSYISHYEKYIGNLKPKKIMEFGIYSTGLPSEYGKSGASLKMWYEFFNETNLILGVDLHNYSVLDNDRIKTMAANGELRCIEEFDEVVLNPWLQKLYNEFQGGKVGMNEIFKKYGSDFCVILDDCSHTMRSNQVILGYTFKYLKSGGIHIIEDLHTSYGSNTEIYNSYPYTDKNTLWVLQNFIKTGKIESDFMKEDEIKYLEENIKEIFIEKGRNSEIAFIIKK